jgi:hypothetical protein
MIKPLLVGLYAAGDNGYTRCMEKTLVALVVLIGGCAAGAVPVNNGDRCAWSIMAPMQLAGSTNTTWTGGVPSDNVPRCNPADGSNGYAASIGIWAPPVAMTLNLRDGSQGVSSWQDFTIATYADGSQQVSSGCQSWRNGSAFVEINDGAVTAHIVADCSDSDIHADVSVTYLSMSK